MWSIEIYEGGNFEKFYLKLHELDQAIVQAAIDHVLKPQGIDVCQNEWGKNLGSGLYEFRIRRSLATIIAEYGSTATAESLAPRYRERRSLLRVFCTFYGDRVVLLLGGYNKGKDPSRKPQEKEIRIARKNLNEWKRQKD